MILQLGYHANVSNHQCFMLHDRIGLIKTFHSREINFSWVSFAYHETTSVKLLILAVEYLDHCLFTFNVWVNVREWFKFGQSTADNCCNPKFIVSNIRSASFKFKILLDNLYSIHTSIPWIYFDWLSQYFIVLGLPLTMLGLIRNLFCCVISSYKLLLIDTRL